MEIDVLFLGVLKYKDKNTQEDKYRVSYIHNTDKAKVNNKNFKGINECSFYTDDPIVFEKLTKDDALTSMKFVIENRPSLTNPLKTISDVTVIKTKNEVLKLI